MPRGVNDPSGPTSGGDDPLALFREYARTRDLAVRNRLVSQHERLVHYLASRFDPAGATSMEDLVQVGFLGLIAAIERFDPNQRVSFVTFAVPTIMGVIKHYLRDHTWAVKAPRRLRDLGMSLRRMAEQMEQDLGRPPTLMEMAEAARVSEEQLLEAMELGRLYQSTSLDTFVADDNGDDRFPFAESVGRPDPELQAIEDREALRHALEHLDARQKIIISQRFFQGASQSQVARLLGISQMQVSRLERQALQRLRILLS